MTQIGNNANGLRVPIYAASSWTSIVSLVASQFLDPIRDIYEVYMSQNIGTVWSSGLTC